MLPEGENVYHLSQLLQYSCDENDLSNVRLVHSMYKHSGKKMKKLEIC